jgi:hypothetical protein
MRYMLLIYGQEDAAAAMSAADAEQIMAGHITAMEDAKRKGILQSAAPLQPTKVATTVRMQDGKALITDGPFAETKEQLAGYYVLDCKNLDEAIEWATRIPTGCAGAVGCIEIRPFRFQEVN